MDPQGNIDQIKVPNVLTHTHTVTPMSGGSCVFYHSYPKHLKLINDGAENEVAISQSCLGDKQRTLVTAAQKYKYHTQPAHHCYITEDCAY